MKTVSNYHDTMAKSSLFYRALRTLRHNGYKVTPQRRAILQVLSESNAHLTPSHIYESVSQSTTSVGLVTVYRTLCIIVELGIACEISMDGRQPTYLLSRPDEHHHHVVCSSCGQVVDFIADDIEQLEQRLAAETGYRIEGHVLEFTGTCPECRRGHAVAQG